MSGSAKVDGVFRTRSLGIAAVGIPDQYADGKAAQVWSKYIGDQNERTGYYKEQLVKILRDHNCKTVLDVACGTGVDSVMLLEEGFQVTSCDASDKMLKHALKTRWERRKEEAFDKWVVEEGNWLHLNEACFDVPADGFDALICMGNSFAHLPDFDGNQSGHFTAVQNFYNMLRPGGILIIDHRNYDHIVSGGKAPMKNIYYSSRARVDCKTSVLMVDGKYHMVTLDYCMFPEGEEGNEALASKFRLSYYPHLLKNFNKLVTDVFGEDASHVVLGDFKPIEGPEKEDNPSYYIHICTRSST